MKQTLPRLFFVALILVSVYGVGVKIHQAKIMDLQGREIRFHGPNVVVKVPPYMPNRNSFDKSRSFSTQDMENLKKWGFNAIRLGMMWAGVEPTPNGYNETYLDEMQDLINQAGSYGIYTLIDFHQDLIAEKFCGDGVPTWLIDEIKGYRNFPFPTGKKIHLNSSGLPDWDACDKDNWGKYYFSMDVSKTFEELYRIGSKLNTKFTEYWKKIATRFKDNKYVIAYELINEPFSGNPYRDPLILIPSMGERFNFQEFYDNLAQQIRKIDTTTPICFEPITFDQKIPAGFSHPPGGNRYRDLSIFCYHYYKPPALGYGTLEARLKDGQRLGIPSMMDQFGTTDKKVLQFAEQKQQSWMFWGYKDFGKNWGASPFYSNEESTTLKNTEAHVRPFMQRIAGNLIREQFNEETMQYVASYEAVPGGKSIVFYSEQLHYVNGPLIQISPKVQVSLRVIEKGYLQITYTGSSQRLVQVSLDKKWD